MDSNINLFPNPPKHYKKFIREDSLTPPDLNILNKLSSYMSFGVEYKMKEINSSSNPVETAFLRVYDQSLIDKLNIHNRGIFEGPNIDIINLTCDNINVNVFDALENEVKFIRKTYNNMLDQITSLQDFELSSCLIKYSYQKIYFFVSLLKKKKILIEIISYFKKEKENNTYLENTLARNLENSQATLQNGLNLIKNEI